MKQFDARNLSMMFDLYEMTMANGYFEDKERDRDDYVSFDVFYRNNPDAGGFAIFAGLEQVLDYLENLHFSTEDISYLRSLHVFSELFLQWLETYQFRGSVYAMPEGSIIYPDEPLLTVYAPLIDAQLVETAILCEINHQSLIATKASRVVQAAEGGVKWDDPDVGVVWPAVDGEIRLSAKDGEHRGFKEQTYEFFERW